jgi:hypothetical protein
VNSDNREHLVHVGAKVEPNLADAVRQLADDGNRSLSREIRAAIAEHVSKESSAPAAASSFSAARSAPPLERGEARAPQLAGIRPSSGAPDGSGPPAGTRPKEAV